MKAVIFAISFWLLSGNSVFAQVVASFSATPTAGCAPLHVTFTDLSTGNPTSWSWNLGNGPVPIIPNPGDIYSSGLWTVTLTVSDGVSTSTIVKTNYINVYNPPTAGFTMSTDTACIGQTVTFTDATVISTGGATIATWHWDFGDGNATTVTTTSTSHAYTTQGLYPISLIVTDLNGCISTITQNILIVPMPTVAFTATPLFACTPPLNVTFTNTSTSIGHTTYTWHFGDGSNSTSTNPTHTYAANGTYTVTLVVNQNGCIDSLVKPNYILLQNMVASFAATPTVVCTGQPIIFNNTSVPIATTASWNFGDAGTSTAISPSHTYTAANTYTVTLNASNGSCNGTTTGIVTVNQTPVANFVADTMIACSVPFNVHFTNNSTGATNYIWNFGDGSPTSNIQNPAHTYTAIGTYSVSLIATNSSGPCSDTIRKNSFIMISPPIAGFTHAPDSGCAPLTVNFLSTSTSPLSAIATYQWYYGDGNNATFTVPGTSHTYTATGVYTVKLIIHTVSGCVDSFICANCIKVGSTPVANFGILKDTVCYGLPVTFSDSSTGNVTGWHWSFGDGGSSIMQNPIYVYGDTGTYKVYLIAYNHGCADTSIKKKVVILPPKAAFTFTLSCTTYFTVHFSSTSEGADSLVWNFGDGKVDTSNNKTPVHTYLVRGPYTISLTAYNYSSKCSNTISSPLVIAKPIANFTVANTSGCYPFTENFTSTSQDADSVFWNFGDPSTLADTSIIVNPAYTYNATGQYPVKLIITDVNGCKNSVIDTVRALGPYPYFYANKLTGCRPLIVTFHDTSTDKSVPDSALVLWTWNFGDGSPIFTTHKDSITHTYTSTGIYSVTMTVKDTNQCTKTIVKTNYIQATFPYPAFTVDTFSCKGIQLTFNASGTNVVGGTYLWNFGDGSIDSTHNPISSITHTYSHDSLYTVILTVRDTNGCDSTIKEKVRILKPTAHFRDTILSVGCGNLVVTFKDSSQGFVSAWNWLFGDGSSSALQNPTHTYTLPGVYNVTLTVTNPGGCTDSLILDSIIVVPGPVGSFSFAPTAGCNPLKVCFHATSINAQYFEWSFGDGIVVNTLGGDTCHIYTNPGNFNPVLSLGNTLPDGSLCQIKATNLTGSVTVTNVINVSINGPHIVHVPLDSIISVTTNYSGGLPPYNFHWSPDTGLSCSNCPSVLIMGLGDTMVYTFAIYDTAGCKGVDSIIVLSEPCFQKKLIPNVFSPNGDGINDMFYIPGVCPYEKYSLQIFDRWGTLMFTSTQRNNGWDGKTTAGEEAPDGVYYFIVKIAGQVDKKAHALPDSTYKGFVQLVR